MCCQLKLLNTVCIIVDIGRVCVYNVDLFASFNTPRRYILITVCLDCVVVKKKVGNSLQPMSNMEEVEGKVEVVEEEQEGDILDLEWDE